MISFQSLSFYLYAVVGFCCINWVKNKNLRKYILFAVNAIYMTLLFYYSKKHLALLFAFVFGNYFLIKLSSQSSYRKLLFIVQIAGSLLFLCFFKYQVIQAPLLSIFPHLGWLLKPAVFIGISFFTFKMISVSVDMYQEKEPQIDLFHFANYLLFFPCFLSGPFDRYERFTQNFEESQTLDSKNTYQAFFRIILGAFKKGIIADNLYSLSSDSVFLTDFLHLNTGTILASHYIYSLVLYFDFSGYSDIAIGISQLFGVKTPENFNNPYFARNIQEFWNKWHISLMHWLRDYVYFPFQKFLISLGIKNFVAIACAAYLFTFFIAGVWHGDNLSFTLYGISHGLAFTVYLIYKKFLETKLTRPQLKAYQQSKLAKIFGILLTYHYFYFSLFFFIQKPATYLELWGRLWR